MKSIENAVKKAIHRVTPCLSHFDDIDESTLTLLSKRDADVSAITSSIHPSLSITAGATTTGS